MHVSRTRQLQLVSVLLAAFTLPATMASAQTYLPSPAVEGTPLTFTLGAPGQFIYNFNLSIYGPSTFNQVISAPLTYSGGGQPTNGVLTLTTPPLAAGLYRIILFTDTPNTPRRGLLYYFMVYGKDGSYDGALQGQYTFQLSGTQNGLDALPVLALGSIATDGQGRVTGGVMDVNSPGTVLQAVPVQGTYRFNVDGSGVLNLTAAQGTFQLPFSAPYNLATAPAPAFNGRPNPSPTDPLDASAYLNAVNIAATVGSGVAVKGTLKQTLIPGGYLYGPGPLQVISPLNGIYNTTLAGGTRTASGAPVFVSGNSTFTFNPSGAVTDQGTLSLNGIAFTYPELTGTYQNFDPVTGRATMTIPNGSAGAPPPESFAVYSLDQGQTFYFLSLTPREQSANVISGQGKHQ